MFGRIAVFVKTASQYNTKLYRGGEIVATSIIKEGDRIRLKPEEIKTSGNEPLRRGAKVVGVHNISGKWWKDNGTYF